MRTSSAIAAALLASSTATPIFASPIRVENEAREPIPEDTMDMDSRFVDADAIAELNNLVGSTHSAREIEDTVSQLEARKVDLSKLGNIGAIVGGGAAALPILGGLFGGSKREFDVDELEARKFSLGAAGNIGSLVGGAAGLLGLLGSQKRDIEDLEAALEARKVDLGKLGSIGSLVGGGAAALPLIGGLFGRDFDVDELEARKVDLGKIGNIATLGAIGLPLISGLFGGKQDGKRDFDMEELEARKFSLGTAGNIGGILGGATGLLGLLGANKRELSADDVLNALVHARSSVPSVADLD